MVATVLNFNHGAASTWSDYDGYDCWCGSGGLGDLKINLKILSKHLVFDAESL
jgi:hypothetical protein